MRAWDIPVHQLADGLDHRGERDGVTGRDQLVRPLRRLFGQQPRQPLPVPGRDQQRRALGMDQAQHKLVGLQVDLFAQHPGRRHAELVRFGPAGDAVVRGAGHQSISISSYVAAKMSGLHG
jgi:hypothetical protein